MFDFEVGNRQIYRSEVISELLKNIEGDYIIEMGSGWGRYSIALANNVTQDIYSLEYTESGRKITEYFSKTFHNGQIKSYPFDYYNADFSMVLEKTNVFVFSSYSIEQITHIKKEVFCKLLDRFNSIKGFHIEPIGWQLPEPHSEAEKRLKTKCLRVGYNTNLYSILKELENEGKIIMTKIIRNFKFDRDDGTIIFWEKI